MDKTIFVQMSYIYFFLKIYNIDFENYHHLLRCADFVVRRIDNYFQEVLNYQILLIFDCIIYPYI